MTCVPLPTTVTEPWTTAPLEAARGWSRGRGPGRWVARSAERHASNAAQAGPPQVVLLSAQGRPFTQAMARELATEELVVLICGRYEGVDERINQLYCDLELSIGDYVLSGGELAAAVVVDATMRLVPGV